MSLFKNACWLHLQPTIGRYLLSCSDGRWDGAEKAVRHEELCVFYVAVVRGIPLESVRRNAHTDADRRRVHAKTQALTDYLDEVIGFPLVGAPDFDELEPKFFEVFHAIAMAVLAPELPVE
jgi:hypothetical protein